MSDRLQSENLLNNTKTMFFSLRLAGLSRVPNMASPPPPYEREGWKPETDDDYGDGGGMCFLSFRAQLGRSNAF